jgi:hypothetical protein
MKWLWRLIVAGVVGVLVWQAWERLFVTEEKRIQRAVAAMERAVEENNIVALADGVAGSYSDEHGLDKASLLAMVRGARSQYATMLIHITDMKIEVATDKRTGQATLIAKVLTTRAGGGGATEINAERVRLFLRKGDDGWKLTRVESPELRFE